MTRVSASAHINVDVEAKVTVRRNLTERPFDEDPDTPLPQVDLVEDGYYATRRTFRVVHLTETYDLSGGYRVRASGPVLTSTGKLHATQTGAIIWRSPSAVPDTLRTYLDHPAQLIAHLALNVARLTDQDIRNHLPTSETP